MKSRITQIDKEYLRRCQKSSPEAKLSWLAAALDFSHAKKRVVRK